MPALLDYTKPIQNLSPTIHRGCIRYVKIPGDDIVSVDWSIVDKLVGTLNEAIGKGSLANYMSNRKEFERSDVERTKIINNFKEEDQDLFAEKIRKISSEKIIYIGLKGDVKIKGSEFLELKNEKYDDIAAEIKEKLGAAEFKEKTLEEIAEEKLSELSNKKEIENRVEYSISIGKQESSNKSDNIPEEMGEVTEEVATPTESYRFDNINFGTTTTAQGLYSQMTTQHLEDAMISLRNRTGATPTRQNIGRSRPIGGFPWHIYEG